MNAFYNRIRRFAAILIGIVFLVSGLLKLMDPVGTGLIVTEYYKFLHLGFLEPTAKGAGMLLALLECIIATSLITGVLRKAAAFVASVFIVVFTIITLVLLIKNPVMDCGCFGQAIHLTHMQSFLKNVALLLLAVLAFVPFRDYGKPRRSKYVAFFLVVPTFFLAVWYNNRHLPLVDLMSFAPGARLFAAGEAEEDTPEPFQATFIYERDGKTASFTLDKLPDSTWTFVRIDTVYRRGLPILRKDLPILSFADAGGNYCDELAAEGKAVVISVYNPSEADWDGLAAQYRSIEEAGARPLVLVSSSRAELDTRVQLFPAYTADYKTLLTLNRSNGGGTYFDQGEVITKWSYPDFPDSIADVLKADPVDVSTALTARRRIKAQGYVLYLAALLILL